MRALKKILKRIFITIILIPAICFGIFAYSIYVEPNLLSVKNIEINNSSNIKNEDTIKIAQISDIHLGEYYAIDKLEKLVNKVNSQNADIITSITKDEAIRLINLEVAIKIDDKFKSTRKDLRKVFANKYKRNRLSEMERKYEF